MSLTPLECVVLIDDDAFDNKYHSRMIHRTGLAREIKIFGMAEDALDWFRREGTDTADIVFLDINMPGMDGFEMLERAQAEFGPDFLELVVMMLTTSMDPHDQARAAEFPVVRRFISKSLTADKFTELVSEMRDAG